MPGLCIREKEREERREMHCDVCGQFVGLTGSRRLLTPDSHFTREEYETLCEKHKSRP